MKRSRSGTNLSRDAVGIDSPILDRGQKTAESIARTNIAVSGKDVPISRGSLDATDSQSLGDDSGVKRFPTLSISQLACIEVVQFFTNCLSLRISD